MPATTDFVPADLDATRWEAIEPLYLGLKDRPVQDAEAFDAWLLDRSEFDAACGEAGARLYINMTCDTADQGHADAYAAFIERVRPKLSPAGFELDKRQVELAERFGRTGARLGVLHRDTKAEVELFREENVPLQTKLSKLAQKYQTLQGAMSVEFEGETRTLPRMAVFQESADRARRESAWRAVAERRLRDRGEADTIFDEMIRLRDEVARNAGEANYVGYAFRAMHRFDYTPADCLEFHDSVEAEVMPFCARLDERRKAELGVDGLKPWDLACDPKGREPLTPFADGAELVAKTRRVFAGLDGELGALFESMGDGTNTSGIATGEMLDLDSRSGKAPGGYLYMQDRSRRPFIFMNAAGVHRDVETMVHEAGHAFHGMLCAAEPLVAYRHSPIEFAEVASMSMELLTMPYWDAIYPDKADADRARRKQLEGSLALLPWIATIDGFQHWLYANPGHTRDERTEAWNGLLDRFGLQGHRVSWDGSTAPSRDARWQAQQHLFNNPFYYIEYGIAQLGALQLWIKGLEQGEAAAVEAYKNALRLGGSRPLPELFDAAGIRFDFSRGMFATIRERVEAELSKLPD